MAYNTIKIKKYVDHIEEFVANAAIKPGMVVELMATGKIRAHAGVSSHVLPMIALEDELQGKDIDDAYAANEKVQVWVPVRGEIFYGIIADGQLGIEKGDFLVSNGDGTLKVTLDSSDDDAKAPQRFIGMSLDTLRLDGSGSESSHGGDLYPRVRVMVL
jgi:hypothetical protein